jgi:uncharacterized protein (TIGR00369 family)
MPAMTADEILAFFAEAFPGGQVRIDHLDSGRAVVRYPYNPQTLRPGGTISGPTMMSLADTGAYVLILGAIGFVPLAVTTSLSINFIRKPGPADLIGEARMLKLGAALAVIEVEIRSHGAQDMCAHAVVTYSIPPRRGERPS